MPTANTANTTNTNPSYSPDTSTLAILRYSRYHCALQEQERQRQQKPPNLDRPPPIELRPLNAVAPAPSPLQLDPEHDPSPLRFLLPEQPLTELELAPLKLNPEEHNVKVLPPLASLTGGQAPAVAAPERVNIFRRTPPPWPSVNPFSAYYSAPRGQSADSPATLHMGSVNHAGRGPLSPGVSIDDPDVKMAAEALGDLKASKPVPTFGICGASIPMSIATGCLAIWIALT